MAKKPQGAEGDHGRIVTIRPDASSDTRQNLPMFLGVSDRSAGAKGISMYKVVIPPGAAAEPHRH